MDHQPLRGQKALVTGANSGIGGGVARALGAAVVVNYVSKRDAAAKIVDGIRGNGVDGMAICGDVSNEAEVEAMFASVDKEWGGNTVLGVNLTGVFLCSRAP